MKWNMKMRNALPLLALICFTGCEAFIPAGSKQALPKPPVVVTPTKDQRIELVIRVDGEGRIKLDGNSTIGITSDSVRYNRCVCGADCGCDITNPAKRIDPGTPTPGDVKQLQQDGDPSVARRRAEKPIVRLYAPEWCGVCKPVKDAFSGRKDLPFDFVVVRGETPAATSYPWITWTRTDGVVMNFDGYTWGSVDNVVNGWRANQ